MSKRGIVAALAAVAMLGATEPAAADITAFLGLSTTPSAHQARGLAIGSGILALGFEFEYSDFAENVADLEPGLRIGSVNGVLQTPVALGGMQLYATAGAGIYRERLAGASETSLAINVGGGAKIRLLGPLRLRLDYRLFSLRGDPLHDRYHRLYAGANVGF